MAGEIAEAFVRIRPDLTGFKATATEGVKAGLTGMQEEVNAVAKANVAAAQEQIAANRALAASYQEIAAAAVTGSDEQIAAQRLAAAAAATTATAVEASAVKSAAAIEGVKAKTLGLGKVLGITFGAAIAVDFVKHLSQDSASIQKSSEVIQSQFGANAKAVIDFSQKAGIALGINAHDSEATAAKFGILFQNIGVGQKQAADMTINLEKLAGSLSAIRGVDPTLALKTLNLAMLGNTRGLKQLGVSIDPVTVKYTAWKLGLISSTKDALPQAARAVAIYTIATQNLGHFQDLAKAHANDLANVQRRLSAEWDHAKENLGEGLLPIFTKLVGFFSSILPEAVKVTQLVFHDLASDARGLAKAFAPVLSPVGSVFGAIHDAFKPIQNRIGTDAKGKPIVMTVKVNGAQILDRLKKNFEDLSPVAKVAAAAVGVLTASLVVMFAAAFPITATILAVVGLGVAFREAYNHSQKFRDIVGEIGDWIHGKLLPAIHSLAQQAAPTFEAVGHVVKKVFDDIVSIVEVFVGVAEAIWHRFGGTITTVVKNDFGLVLTTIRNVFRQIGDVFDFFNDLLHGKWGKAWGALKDIAHTELNQVIAVAKTWGSNILAVFEGIWEQIELIFLTGVQKALDPVVKVVGVFTGILGHLGVHVGNPAKALQQTIQDIRDGIANANNGNKIADGVVAFTAAALAARTSDATLVSSAQAVGKSIGDNIRAGAGKGDNLSTEAAAKAAADAQAKATAKLAALNGKLRSAIDKQTQDVKTAVENAKENLSSIGSSLATSIGTILDQPFVLAGQRIQAAQNKIALQFDAQSAKLAKQAADISHQQSLISFGQDKLSLENFRRSFILPGGGELSENNDKAIRQLKDLIAKGGPNTGSLKSALLQFQSQVLTVKSDKVGLAQQSLDARRTALTSVLQLKSEFLAVEQDTANKLKTKLTTQIADLVDAFNRHKISYTQFTSGINSVVSQATPAYKKAGKTLGTAFGNQFVQDAADVLKQAGIITSSPQLSGATGQNSKVVNPLATLAKDQTAVEKIRTQIGNQQVALQGTLVKQSKKQTDYLKTIAQGHGKASSKDKNPGTQGKVAGALTGTGH